MRKLLALICLLPLLAFSQAGPVYIKSTNGVAWPATLGEAALTIKSNVSMGIGGSISWPTPNHAATASLRFQPDIHGAGIGLLSLSGGPDANISEGSYGGSLQFGGGVQIGSHGQYGGEVRIAYAGLGDANLPGHGKPVGFEALYNNGVSQIYSKFTLLGRPGTNIVSSGWANGYLEGWDVPPLWNNTAFSVLPNQEAGRLLFRVGEDGFLFRRAGAGFSGAFYTNSGASGAFTTTWQTGNNTPEGAVVATVGSIFSRANGGAGTSLYVKESGTGNTGWTAIGGGGSGTNTWYEDGAVDNAVRLGNTTGNSELIRVFTAGVADTPTFSVNADGNTFVGGNFNVFGALTMTAWNADDLAMGFYNDGALDRVTGLTAGQSIRVDSGGTGFEAYTPVSASSSPTLTGVTITGGTVTASDPVLEMTQTWNSGGVTFTGVDMNITDTASATASRLMDIRVGGNPMVRIKKIGTIEGRGGMVLHGNPTGFAGTAPSDGQLVLSDGSGNAIIRVAQNSGGQINLASGGVLSFTGSSTDSTTTKDTIVSRPSAGVVSIDTTAAGNSAGLVKANGYFEGLFSTATGFTLTATNSIVKVTTSATVTFPTAVGITGRSYTLKAMTGVTITLATTSSQTIDGAAPGTITALQARRITSDGANWIITAGF